jgi:hypothetical protein
MLALANCTLLDGLNGANKNKNAEQTESLILLAALVNTAGCRGFWTSNVFTGATVCTPATLVQSGTYADIYVQNGLENIQSEFGLTKLNYSTVASTFDSNIYPKVTAASGAPTDINQDKKITILIMDINDALNYNGSGGYVAGYVDPLNFFIDAPAYGFRSNQREMLVIDGVFLVSASAKSARESKPDAFYATIAHEFQHLIRFPYEISRATATAPIDITTIPSSVVLDPLWINEGTSEVMSDVAGYGPQSDRMKCFRGDPTATSSSCTNGFLGKSLVSWSSTIMNYSYAYAFMSYLYFNSGNTASDQNSFLQRSISGSIRGKDVSSLMSVFSTSAKYNSTLLGSSTSDIYRRLLSLFLAQSLKYPSTATAYYGSTNGTAMSTMYATYSYPPTLSNLLNMPSYLPEVTGSSFELYPTVTYRVKGTSLGPSNSNAVVVQSGTEYLIFNSATVTNTFVSTTANILEKNVQEPAFSIRNILEHQGEKEFCTHQYFMNKFENQKKKLSLSN